MAFTLDDIKVSDPIGSIKAISDEDNKFTSPLLGELFKKNAGLAEWKEAATIAEQLAAAAADENINDARIYKAKLTKTFLEKIIPKIDTTKTDVNDLKKIACLYVGLFKRAVYLDFQKENDKELNFIQRSKATAETALYKKFMKEWRVQTWAPYLNVALGIAHQTKDNAFAATIQSEITNLMKSVPAEKNITLPTIIVSNLKASGNKDEIKLSPKEKSKALEVIQMLETDIGGRRMPEPLNTDVDTTLNNAVKLMGFTDQDVEDWNECLATNSQFAEFTRICAPQIKKINDFQQLQRDSQQLQREQKVALERLVPDLEITVDFILSPLIKYYEGFLPKTPLDEAKAPKLSDQCYVAMHIVDTIDKIAKQKMSNDPITALKEMEEALRTIPKFKTTVLEKNQITPHIKECLKQIEILKNNHHINDGQNPLLRSLPTLPPAQTTPIADNKDTVISPAQLPEDVRQAIRRN